MDQKIINTEKSKGSLLEILMVSTKLGLTSFGGPIAHLGYFHEEYIRRRKWMDEKSYAELVALCQFLPGPASSQVGIGIGVMRAGVLGGIVSFLGFTLPSVVALMIFALILQGYEVVDAGWIHGLKVVAVAIVAHAILGMAQKLTPDLKRKVIALVALVGTLLWQSAYTQVIIILFSAIIGYLIYKEQSEKEDTSIHFPISRRFGVICLMLFFALLLLLPVLRETTSLHWIALFDSFYRSGSLVFGGGHVVLPLLEREFVPTGWLSEEAFLAGYGATQAVPGPLFTFAAYLGTVMKGWLGGIIATVAIFLPAFLLILGTLPFWDKLRSNPKINGALMGVNAAVVGILISAFYQPIWTSSILGPIDFAFAAILFSMLVYWKLPPWVIVLTGAIGGALLSNL
ncbi:MULTISPECIES: chromate transporter [unclassified Bacillus (in: firmicutes)]|uniref:chromate transporter n=1 Tax=unclassified Bacillus (in: firmicutes) TaxID=185979 RepID=UPI0008E96D35|nr:MULTISPECIES: chromate transporter [unclassified Bacillus (in: firmicutes)]SFB02498.1 chromate transporter [Bacillus sp. UNCCL13]SFQ89071.1 chromate transporter [Bacillus sp. cl95]